MELTEASYDLFLLTAAMLATGALGGILAGLLGVGGGIVVVPVLFSALTLLDMAPEARMHIAVATSLATIIPTSISSMRAHHAKKAVDWPLVAKWGVAIAAGAILGGFVARFLRSEGLGLVFAVVATGVAVYLSAGKEGMRAGESLPGGVPGQAMPASIGTFSALMGIGGGTLSVPILSIFGVPVHRAVATASVFGLLIAVPGTIAFAVSGWANADLPPFSIGYVNLLGFVLIAPLQTALAPLGARMAHAASPIILRRLFAGFLLATAIKMFFSAFG